MPVVADLLRQTYVLDGYPPVLPDDVERFLRPPDLLGAWVAEVDGVVVGHVANHARSSPEVMAAAATAAGRPEDELAVLARLLVDPAHRRSGIAGALIRCAEDAARRSHRWPVLDVPPHFAAAIRGYERAGWTRAATVSVTLRRGPTFQEHVYLGPPPPAAAHGSGTEPA